MDKNKTTIGPATMLVPIVVLALASTIWLNSSHVSASATADAQTNSAQQSSVPVPGPQSKPPASAPPGAVPPAPSHLAQILVVQSQSALGQKLWAATPWADLTNNGDLGCAAAVSKVLLDSDVKLPGSPAVVVLVKQLADIGWQRIGISNAGQYRSGDVVYGTVGDGSGGHAHVGIIKVIDGHAWVYENDSSSGKWVFSTLGESHSFVPGARFPSGHLFVMRPPD